MRSLSSGLKEGKDFWGMEIPKEKEGKGYEDDFGDMDSALKPRHRVWF